MQDLQFADRTTVKQRPESFEDLLCELNVALKRLLTEFVAAQLIGDPLLLEIQLLLQRSLLQLGFLHIEAQQQPSAAASDNGCNR